MLAVSDAWDAAIIRPHRIVAFAEAEFDGVTTTLPVTGFNVTVDSGSQCRRSIDLTVAGTSLIPTEIDSPLAVNGQLVRAYRGIVYADGSQEVQPLGVFRIDDWSADTVRGPVTVRGLSLECLLADDRFEAPRTLQGASVQTVIRELCVETAPMVEVVVTASSDAVCPAFVGEEDRLAVIRQLAKSIGAEFRADAYGRFELRDVPSVTNPVAWRVDQAAAVDNYRSGGGKTVRTRTYTPGALVSARQGASRDGVYNAVTARGENLSDDYPPVTATVIDADPDSPTYYYGPWGKKRRFYASPLLTTTGQCLNAGAAILASSVGVAKTLTLESVCNPALEDGDVVQHNGQLHIVDAFTIGSQPSDGMTLTTRSTKVPDELS